MRARGWTRASAPELYARTHSAYDRLARGMQPLVQHRAVGRHQQRLPWRTFTRLSWDFGPRWLPSTFRAGCGRFQSGTL
jgi:hypothetical protein